MTSSTIKSPCARLRLHTLEDRVTPIIGGYELAPWDDVANALYSGVVRVNPQNPLNDTQLLALGSGSLVRGLPGTDRGAFILTAAHVVGAREDSTQQISRSSWAQFALPLFGRVKTVPGIPAYEVDEPGSARRLLNNYSDQLLIPIQIFNNPDDPGYSALGQPYISPGPRTLKALTQPLGTSFVA